MSANGNRKTRTVKVRTVVAAKPFKMGYADAHAGKGPRRAYETMSEYDQRRYEDGRAFFAGLNYELNGHAPAYKTFPELLTKLHNLTSLWPGMLSNALRDRLYV